MATRIFFSLVLLLVSSVLTISSQKPQDPDAINIAKGILQFGQQIVAETLNTREQNSEIISPLCIAGVLYLLQLGAARSTSMQLERLLGINGCKLEIFFKVRNHKKYTYT